MNINIRREKEHDKSAVWKINSEVFDTEAEAKLVDILRISGIPHISLVAEKDGEIVGHIMFTPVELLGCDEKANIMGLGPMAVLTDYQRMGIGSELVKEGLETCKRENYDTVVVLGHPEYYSKFGFTTSVNYKISCEFDVPSEAFMILELKKGSLNEKYGIIKYNEAFESV